MITILLVDDQNDIRRGLRMRLGLEPDIAIVGEACDGESALSLAEALAPRVVLMDVEMPCMDGIAAAEQLARRTPGCRVVMLSLHDDAATKQRAARAGASAFVAKHDIDRALMDAIRRAADGPGAAP